MLIFKNNLYTQTVQIKMVMNTESTYNILKWSYMKINKNPNLVYKGNIINVYNICR